MRNTNQDHRTAARRRSLLSRVPERVGFEPLEERRLMSGGEVEPPDPIVADQYEPNNSFAAATNLGSTLNTYLVEPTLHQVGTAVDVDYYKFTAPTNGVVIAQIGFTHLQGNLKIVAYNSAQQQIAFSDTSTPGNGTETVSIGAQAGQTYYLRVYGQTSPGYSFDLRGLNAAFDWNMPKRTGTLLDPYGMPMFPNTPDYARPNPVIIGGVETARYPVSLFSTGTVAGDGVNYQWYVTGSQYTTSATGASVTVDLPQGQYNVQLNATVGGSTVTTNQTITVKDILVVGIGDSYGSGESNPHRPQQYDWLGYTSSGAKWADSLDAQEAIYHRMAHRSASAAVARAAVDLENSDPKSSVTFVFLDHTGATVLAGLLGEQPSGEYAVPGNSPAQIPHLAQIIGNRKIDQLVISIGGNDLGFGPVLAGMVQADPLYSGGNYYNELQGIFDTALTNINLLGTNWYPALNAALQQFDIGQTFLVEYPDLTKSTSGTFAEKILDDIAPTFEADQYELQRAYNTLVSPFQSVMREACRKFGWSYIDGVDEQYHNHGYGDWLRRAPDSAVSQGPLSANYWPIPLWSLQNTNGTMHPINGGLDAQRDRINENINLPNLATQALSVSPSAFMPGVGSSTYSLTITNTSYTTSAAASVADIRVSPDSTIDNNDITVATVAVPALSPGQSVTLTGTLPALEYPIQTPTNSFHVGAKLDVNGQVTENNEPDNSPWKPSQLVALSTERDLRYNGSSLRLQPTVVDVGSSTYAQLGIDEILGGADLDVFTFNASAGQRLGFDIDAAGSLNTFIRVYKVTGGDFISLDDIVVSNDNGAAPGESPANASESYLSHTFATAGQYAVVVGHATNAFTDPMSLSRYPVPGGTGSYTLSINVLDTVAPVLQSSSFDVQANRLLFTFSENVGSSIKSDSVTLVNLTSGQTISTTANYDVANNTARFSFNGFSSGLSAGNYRATIARGSVYDTSGNTLDADVTLDFFALPGDATRDRKVNTIDFNLLAGNFGGSAKTFSQGNFNYDGAVDSLDFAILVGRYGSSLPAAASAAAPSIFGTQNFGDTEQPNDSDLI